MKKLLLLTGFVLTPLLLSACDSQTNVDTGTQSSSVDQNSAMMKHTNGSGTVIDQSGSTMDRSGSTIQNGQSSGSIYGNGGDAHD